MHPLQVSIWDGLRKLLRKMICCTTCCQRKRRRKIRAYDVFASEFRAGKVGEDRPSTAAVAAAWQLAKQDPAERARLQRVADHANRAVEAGEEEPLGAKRQRPNADGYAMQL